MKNKFITLLAIILVIPFLGNAQKYEQLLELHKNESSTFSETQQIMNNYYNSFPDDARKPGYKQFKRWEWFWSTRLDQSGNYVDGTRIIDAYTNSMDYQKNMPKLQGMDWSLVGPVNTPEKLYNSTGLGRINAIELHPTDTKTIFIGAAGGGIWRTKDMGENWEQVYPNRTFYTMGINDISISKSNPKVIYAVTGDAFGAGSGHTTYSIGVIKSTDGGNTWSQTGYKSELANKNLLTRVLCHRDNENIALITTNSGIYKTIDGGENWTRVYSSGNFFDMEVKPSDNNTVYASTLGWNNAQIYKTIDFGDTWTRVLNVGSRSRRIQLAVTKDDAEMVYALVSDINNGYHSFWISEDSGDNFETMSKIDWSSQTSIEGGTNILGWDWRGKPETAHDGSQGQGWYDLCVAVDPNDASKLFTGGVHIWKSSDYGQSFEAQSNSRALHSLPYIHADAHDLDFSADGSILFAATDGGIAYTTTDTYKEWIDISNGLPITQFYRMGSDPKNKERLICGAQDNSTMKKDGDKWTIIRGGDGADCDIDPENEDFWYYSYVNGEFDRSIDAGVNRQAMVSPRSFDGEQASWIAPIKIDPLKTSDVYVGFKKVYRSRDFGKSGWSALSDFSNGSPLTTISVYGDYIYCATAENIWYSKNGGATWKPNNNVKGTWNTPITGIAIDQKDPAHYWVSFGGFTDGKKVYEVRVGEEKDYINLSGNIENIPINVIVYQADSPDRVIIGSDIGVYSSDYGSGLWDRYGEGLPNTIVTDINLLPQFELIRVSTYGRGIWEAPLVNCNLEAPETEALGETSFCPGGSVKLRAKGNYSKYVWSNGMTGKEITVKKSGLYSLIITEGNCTAKSAPIEVIVYKVPELIIEGKNEQAFCEGQNDEVKLVATKGFATWEWSNGDSGQIITVTETGNYSLTATTAEGCTATAEFEVIEVPVPDKPILWKNGTIIGSNSETHAIAVKYQWYKNNKKLLGQEATKSSYVLDTANGSTKYIGYYQLKVWDQNGCESISDSLHAATDVKDLGDNEYITIAPNPVINMFNLNMQVNISGNLYLEISDMNGKTVYSDVVYVSNGSLDKNINLSNFATGAYIIKIQATDRTWVRSIIKN